MCKKNKINNCIRNIKRIIAVILAVAIMTSSMPEIQARAVDSLSEASLDTAAATDTEETQGDSQAVPEEVEGENRVASGDAAQESQSAAQEQEEEAQTSDGGVTETFASGETSEIFPGDYAATVYAAAMENTDPAPGLTIEEALNISKGLAVKPIEQAGEVLTINGRSGLILLSQIKPEVYKTLTLNLATTEGGWDISEEQTFTYTDGNGTSQSVTYGFLGLGSTEYPFSGTLSFAGGSTGYSFLAHRSLFNALSTDALLPGTISFMMDDFAGDYPVLAEMVKKGDKGQEMSCDVTLTTGMNGSSAVTDVTIGGVIGTLGEEAKVKIKLTVNSDFGSSGYIETMTVSGNGNRGLFCNTMLEGSGLTAVLANTIWTTEQNGGKSAQISVKALTGDAGGFVGQMAGNNSLTVSTVSGAAVNTVTADAGNAGGLVGSANHAAIQVASDGEFSLSNVSVTAVSLTAGGVTVGGNAGGLVGEYTSRETEALSLVQFYDTNKKITLAGSRNAGGVFGVLKNTGSLSISGSAVSSTLSGTTGSYGGLIGAYEALENGESQAPARKAELSISGVTVTSTNGDKASSYGGVIGTVKGNRYVVIKDVSASTAAMPTGSTSYFGGLAGKMENGMLNVGNVSLNSNDNNIAADAVGGRGGLVGYIARGVLRLHGTTDLSKQKITAAYHHTGQIVGNNGSGLVYAVGDGSGNYGGSTSEDPWTLKRYSGDGRSGSDIGNWGEVLRLDGATLREAISTDPSDDETVFILDRTNHTVTVLGAVVTANDTTETTTLAGTRDFAAYALAFNCNSGTDYPTSNSGSSVLIFSQPVDWNKTQAVTLNGDVNLTGTGIQGIGRDDNSQTFNGTFNGGGNSIILDIGSKYGEGTAEDSVYGSGQIYTRYSDNRNGHHCVALFPHVSSATIENLIVDGTVSCLISKNGGNKDDRWPVFVAAVVGIADRNTTFNDVTVNANVSVADEGENASSKELYVIQGGILGQHTGNGELTFSNCVWSAESTISNTHHTNNRVGGFDGRVLGSTTIKVSGCTLSGKIQVNDKERNDVWVGGLIAESRYQVQENNGNFKDTKNNNLLISDLNAKGVTIETKATSTCGGLLGYKWSKTDVTFGGSVTGSDGNPSTASTGVTISGCKLNAYKAKFGGLVCIATGHWDATAANSILFVRDTDAQADNQASSFVGKTGRQGTSALLVADGIDDSNKNDIKALYLEVGTFGKSGTAYYIEPGAVNLTLTSNNIESDYFDELVGWTQVDSAGHCNGVVSLRTGDAGGKIDTGDTPDTYTGQLGEGINYKSFYTRYYYNLSNITDNITTLTTPLQVMTWSASQYAASNIKSILFTNCDANIIIEGNVDLTNYSYYPVTPRKEVTVQNTTLTFGYDTIQDKEKSNKQPSDSEHQHYLMHHGLLYNTGSNVTVKGTTFAGSVGLFVDVDADADSKFASGALVFGSINGDPTKESIEVIMNQVTLSGLCVTGVNTSTQYAPLLINKITQATKLTVSDLSTASGYVKDGSTVYAATSLIGQVGSREARKLALTFSGIALDSRISETTDKTTSVYNNGYPEREVKYSTTHTIFTKATLLYSFQYTSDSSGVYNFNSTDNKVTYGVEISNTASESNNTPGRNPGEQYFYYDIDDYSWDGTETKPDADSIGVFYSSEKYLRYVFKKEGETDNCHELDINLRIAYLSEGCGTYGHPYKITDGKQIIALADFLNNGKANNWVVCVEKNVYNSKKQDLNSYHVDTSENHTYYICDGEKWYKARKENGKFVKEGSETSEITIGGMRAYLRNAYYQIQNDINISSNTYMGIGNSITSGDTANAFSGVIVGKNLGTDDQPMYPTVYISSNILSAKDFGGIVRYSQGSVVKDLNISYAGLSIQEGENSKEVFPMARITVNNTAEPGSNNNPFFGGVVGYCMGGDTIIDNVSVFYGEDSVILSGAKARRIAAGGYIGIVGGVNGTGNYEKTGGGVVFRDISQESSGFLCKYDDGTNKVDCEVSKEAPVFDQDGNITNQNDYSTFFYCNPYVGRVLDGYACYDGGTAGNSTLKNTDKNYTIPDVAGDSGLTVSKNADNSLNVSVTSAQGLWLLSAIVNSGAGAMDSTGKYSESDGTNTVDAYQIGKPRTTDYANIGVYIPDDNLKNKALEDEACWGGILSGATVGQDKNRVSFLVKNFTKVNDGTYYAAQLTGTNINSTNNSVNNAISIEFSAKDTENTFNMVRYANGFRGIGASYGYVKAMGNYVEDSADCYKQVMRRSLYVSKVTGNSAAIVLNMNQKLYRNEISTRDNQYWANQGVGLFVNLGLSSNECIVQAIKLTGNIHITYFGDSGINKEGSDRLLGESGAGAFAARTLYSADGYTLKFQNLTLYDVRVSGAANSGGVIGTVARKKTNLIFESVTATDVQVSTLINNDGNVGGLIGYFAPKDGFGSCVVGGQDARSIFTNIKLSIKGRANDYVAMGGLIGKCENRDFVIQNCSFTGTNTIQASQSKQCGGLIGCAGGGGKIDNVTVTGLTITANGTSGTGGLVGESQANCSDLQISNVIIGSVIVSNPDNNAQTGGLVGYLNGSKAATIQSVNAENLYVLSNYHAGGLVGKHEYSTLNISDVTLTNIITVTKNQYAGLLAGYSSGGKTINGYNILAVSCKVGYKSGATVEELQAQDESLFTAKNSDKKGLWLGKNDNSSCTLKLVAVAAMGIIFPLQDVGSPNNGTVQITYADYPADQSYKPDGTNGAQSSAHPWVDVNPLSNVTVKVSATAATSTILTGNGVGYIRNEEGSVTTVSVPQAILQEAKKADSSTSRTYFNLPSDIAELLLKDSSDVYLKNVYLTTYQEEEKGNTIVPGGTDFPILVMTGLADADTADTNIWNYIAALTNVKDGQTAKNQVAKVTAVTYRWTADEGAVPGADGTVNGSFIRQSSASLSVEDASKKITVQKNVYDNQNNQFTLLDVKYNDPTGSNTNGFHLYVPVLVKKVLYSSFRANFLTGTNYYKENYYLPDEWPSGVINYATAGFGETVTAYFEYNYDRKRSDWQQMLDNGDDLLWNYHKVLNLASGNLEASPLPYGTRLTLVDRQTSQCYTHEFSTGDSVHQFDLSNMTALDGTTKFQPVPICDLLGLTISGPVESPVEGTTYYVAAESIDEATVRVGTTYYRRATTEDSESNKYIISVGADLSDNTDGKNYLPNAEGYYLTIQVPATENAFVVNKKLYYASKTMTSESAPLASIQDGYGSSYVIYDGVQQDFTIDTVRISNGTEQPDTRMEDGDSIQIDLSCVMSLTDQGKDSFGTYTPSEVNHQFNVYLKKYLSGAVEDMELGAVGAHYTYSITKEGETEAFYTDSGTVYGSEMLKELPVACKSSAAQDMAQYLKNNINGSLSISARITLTYPTLGTCFPAREGSETNNGVSVVGVSRIASAASQLPITAQKETKEDVKRYFTDHPSSAKLSYYTYEGDGEDDEVQQLGINPSDNVNDLMPMLYTQGDYDYSAISEKELATARYISYRLELFQKQDDGSYQESAPLGRVDEYLPTVMTVGGDSFHPNETDGPKSLVFTKEFTKDASLHDFIKINVMPLTGTQFEAKDFVYSNYKLRLTIVLLDESKNEIASSKASDYIIYTNARIYQQLF